MEELLNSFLRFGVDVLPVSVAGWLGLRLLVWSAGKAERFIHFGGPYSFLAIWALACFVKSKTLAGSSSALDTLYFALLALGLLACLVRLIVLAFVRSSRP
jgi:hypothetical protein